MDKPDEGTISLLPAAVRSYLRSGVAITSATQCVEELLLNALDAGATCVAVRVDLPCFKIQVVDNGAGMQQEELNKLGERYWTSKCHTVEDLDHLCYSGYRGEAIASLREACSVLEVVSKTAHSSRTYCRMFQRGEALQVVESKIPRPSVGTTVTVHDLFYNFPVRKKATNENLELERIKQKLEGLALMRPKVSISLRNDVSGSVLLQTHKCDSTLKTFGFLFGNAKADVLSEVRGQRGSFSIEGYIGKEGHTKKDLRFVYVNGRQVLKTRLHKVLNQTLAKSLILKRKNNQGNSPFIPKQGPIKDGGTSSPSKLVDRYPMFVINVTCPLTEYDITFDPAKTLVEFKDWNTLISCITEAVEEFLKKENLTTGLQGLDEDGPVVEEEEGGGTGESLKEVSEHPDSGDNGTVDFNGLEKPVISTADRRHGLFSKIVKRPGPSTETGWEGDAENEVENDKDGQKNDDETMPSPPGTDSTNSTNETVQMDQSPSVQGTKATITTRLSENENCQGPDPVGFKTPEMCKTNPGKALAPKIYINSVQSTNGDCCEDMNRKQQEPDYERANVHVSSLSAYKQSIGQSPSPQNRTVSLVQVIKDRLAAKHLTNEEQSEDWSSTVSTLHKFRLKPTLPGTTTAEDSKSLNSIHITNQQGKPTTASTLSLNAEMPQENCMYETDLRTATQASSNDQNSCNSGNKFQIGSLRGSSLDFRTNKPAVRIPEDDSLHSHTTLDQTTDISNENTHSRMSRKRNSGLDGEGTTTSSKLSKIMKGTSSSSVEKMDIGLQDSSQSQESNFVTNTHVCGAGDALSSNLDKDHALPNQLFGDHGPDFKFEPALSYIDLDEFQNSSDKCNVNVNNSEGALTTSDNFIDSVFQEHSEQSPNDKFICESGNLLGNEIYMGFDTFNGSRHVPNPKMCNAISSGNYEAPVSTALKNVRTAASEPDYVQLSNGLDLESGDHCGRSSMSACRGKVPITEHLDLPLKTILNVPDYSTVCKFSVVLPSPSRSNTSTPDSQCIDPRNLFAMSAAHSNSGASLGDAGEGSLDLDLKDCFAVTPDEDDVFSDSELTRDGPPTTPVDVGKTGARTVPPSQGFVPSSEQFADSEEDEKKTSGTCKSTEKSSPKLLQTNVETLQSPTGSTGFSPALTDNFNDLELNSQFTLINSQTSPLVQQMEELPQLQSTGQDSSEQNTSHSKNSSESSSVLESVSMTQLMARTPTTPTYFEDDVEHCCGSETELAFHSPVPGLMSQESPTSGVETIASSNTSALDVVDRRDSDSALELDNGLNDGYETNPAETESQSKYEGHQSLEVRGGDQRQSEFMQLNKEYNSRANVIPNDSGTTTGPDPMEVDTDTTTKGDNQEQFCGDVPSPSSVFSSWDASLENKIVELSTQCDPEEFFDSNGISDSALVKADCEECLKSAYELVKEEDKVEKVLRNKSGDEEEHSIKKKIDIQDDTIPSTSHINSTHDTIPSTSHINSTPSASHINTSHSHSPKHGWIQVTDPNTGKALYVSKTTGSTIPEEQWIQRQSAAVMATGTSVGSYRQSECAAEIIDKAKKTSISKLSPDTQNALLAMVDDHVGSSDVESGVKWRNKQPEVTDKGNTVEGLFKEWQNPVFERPEKDVVSTDNIQLTRSAMKAYQALHPCKFTKAMLNTIKVIGQVDNKFIASLMSTDDKNMAAEPDLLVVIDQHAAHERIRLERLTEEYFTEGEDGEMCVVSCSLDPAESLVLSEEIVRVMLSYKQEFSRIGVNVSKDTLRRDAILIHSIPACIVEKDVNGVKKKREKIYWDIVENVIKDHVQLLKSTKGATGRLPQVLHKLLCLQACHGAIKFGDPLTLTQCEELISSLSRCNLPFQCAHGRPSVMPVLQLQQLKTKIPQQAQKRPKLYRITRNLENDTELKGNST